MTLAGAIDAVSFAMILAGAAFVLTGAIGLFRMPDLFTRMQAASIIDTTGAGLMLTGFMLQAGYSLVTLKLIFIAALLFYIGPVISHALARAALHEGVEPQLAEDRRKRPGKDKP